MKKQKVILFIIIILLCLVLVNIISNKNIKKETITIREMSETTQVSDLQTQISTLNASHEEYAKNVQAYKTKIAEAITNQGVPTSADAKTEVIVDNIGKILQEKTIATATAAQILKGQTAWVNGSKITGTMVDRGAVTKTLNAGGSYTIPAGYHNGSGKVTANSLASQTQATATANNITSGKTAWVNGKLITGSASNNVKVLTLDFNPYGTISKDAGGYSYCQKFSANISSLYSNYKNLNINNIYVQINTLPASSWTSSGYEYDSSTGEVIVVGTHVLNYNIVNFPIECKIIIIT